MYPPSCEKFYTVLIEHEELHYKVEDLEEKNQQLTAENVRLQTENQQLKDEFVEKWKKSKKYRIMNWFSKCVFI